MADSFTSLLSGGLLDTSYPNYAGAAKRNEARRQGLINMGLDQINAVFGGGSTQFFTPADPNQSKFDPKSTYFTLNKKGDFAPYWAPGGAQPQRSFTPNTFANLALGNDLGSVGIVNRLLGDNASPAVRGLVGSAMNPINPLGGFLGGALGGLFGSEESPKDKARKAFRRGQLYNAPQEMTFEGFQEPFYQQRAQDYVNYALPQLAQQYRQNREQMLFGLSNRGLSDSSVAEKASSDLEREAGRGRQTIAETGIEQSNQLRRDIEQARQQAISQLYQSSNPAEGLRSAVNSAQSFQRPSTFAPVVNMFGNLAQQYYTSQLLNNYRQPFRAPNDDGLSQYLAPLP